MKVLPGDGTFVRLRSRSDWLECECSPVGSRLILLCCFRVIEHTGLGSESVPLRSAVRPISGRKREAYLRGNGIGVVGFGSLEPKPLLLNGCSKRRDCVHRRGRDIRTQLDVQAPLDPGSCQAALCENGSHGQPFLSRSSVYARQQARAQRPPLTSSHACLTRESG
ncbi:hypothetical protein VTK56DRAFT_921 [Thermocarpiscus australiensis]